MTDPHDPRDWRKSSFSGSDGDCVELPHLLDGVRDSKNPRRALSVNVRHLVAAVKAEAFGR